MKESLTYADAGVDIDKANKLVDAIGEIAKQTARAGVMSDIGGFGGLFSLNLANLDKPVLVSSTDGVGTKLKIAFMLDAPKCKPFCVAYFAMAFPMSKLTPLMVLRWIMPTSGTLRAFFADCAHCRWSGSESCSAM